MRAKGLKYMAQFIKSRTNQEVYPPQIMHRGLRDEGKDYKYILNPKPSFQKLQPSAVPITIVLPPPRPPLDHPLLNLRSLTP